MAKLSKKQINMIIENTPKELHGKEVGHFALVQELGSFQKEGANWSYRAGWLENGQLVVVCFGHVE